MLPGIELTILFGKKALPGVLKKGEMYIMSIIYLDNLYHFLKKNNKISALLAH